MKKYPFILIFSLFVFLSCKQESNQITEANIKLILDFQDDKVKPIQKISTFVEVSFDARKIEKIILSNPKTDLSWKSDDLIQINYSDKMLCGYPNFVLPENIDFESGIYELEAQLFDETNITQNFAFEYDKEILSYNSEQCNKWMIEHNAKQKLIIFNSDNMALYFGDQTDDLLNEKDISLRYNNAAYYNSILIYEPMNIICKLPAKVIQSGENNE